MAVLKLDVAAKQDIVCRRGDTFKLDIAFKTAGVPIDLTGLIIRMHVKNFSNIILSFTIGNGITVSNPSSGVIRLLKPKEDMSAVKPNTYKYDLEFTYPSGDRLTTLEGDFTVDPDYTI